jgi:hypothetical protein
MSSAVTGDEAQIRSLGGMSRRLETQFDFLANYEVAQVDRIDRSGGRRAFGYPDATAIDPQQEVADRPIVEVNPGRGHPWVGVFHGGEYGAGRPYGSLPVLPGRIFGWPDEWSICVVYGGAGVVVRTDDPLATYEIDPYPISSAAVLPELGIVVFTDWLGAAGYDRNGLIWRSERLAADDLRIDAVDGHEIHLLGFFGWGNERFVLDARTGANRSPYS